MAQTKIYFYIEIDNKPKPLEVLNSNDNVLQDKESLKKWIKEKTGVETVSDLHIGFKVSNERVLCDFDIEDEFDNIRENAEDGDMEFLVLN